MSFFMCYTYRFSFLVPTRSYFWISMFSDIIRSYDMLCVSRNIFAIKWVFTKVLLPLKICIIAILILVLVITILRYQCIPSIRSVKLFFVNYQFIRTIDMDVELQILVVVSVFLFLYYHVITRYGLCSLVMLFIFCN